MKISRDRLADNKRRILDAAAGLMRERGCDGVSVSDITKAAGLTHGAFYNHFESKDDLVANVFAHVLSPEGSPGAKLDLDTFAQRYLSLEHRDDQAGGCIFSALGCEAARASPATRAVITKAVKAQIERFSLTAPGDTVEERRRIAITHWAAMIGAMVLARAVDDDALSEELLSETLAAFDA
jgi:TetR/AcrR family transcriptional repressor of nem operon